jgi:hypothetical protein
MPVRSWIGIFTRAVGDLLPKNSAMENWCPYPTDPPRKTLPCEAGNSDLHGSVSARLAGTNAVNVTQVMVSIKKLETGA